MGRISARLERGGPSTRGGVRSRGRRFGRWPGGLLLLAIAGGYPAFVLAAVYGTTLRSGLPGGSNGPGDAYRHCLASAIVAYTATPVWVDWVTAVMENDGEGDAARAMDAHNNRIGARIGEAAGSWSALQAEVRAAVDAGGIDVAEPDRVTWLPRAWWRERMY
ncbi:MAG: hypothetical protein R3F35_08910 [Myxococcota bacterium]